MPNGKDNRLFSCRNISWMLAILFGILVVCWMRSNLDWAYIVALVVGLIATLGAGWLLTAYFCDSKTVQADESPAPSPASTTSSKGASAVASTETSASLTEPTKPEPLEEAPSEVETAKPDVEDDVRKDEKGSSETVAAKPKAKAPTKKAAAGKTTKAKNTTASAELPKDMVAPADGKPALYKDAPKDADDLKTIKGVGPGLEKTLNELGIFTFAQISEWKAKDIAWVDDNLKFKGRIKRDNWVKQAKTLSKGDGK